MHCMFNSFHPEARLSQQLSSARTPRKAGDLVHIIMSVCKHRHIVFHSKFGQNLHI